MTDAQLRNFKDLFLTFHFLCAGEVIDVDISPLSDYRLIHIIQNLSDLMIELERMPTVLELQNEYLGISTPIINNQQKEVLVSMGIKRLVPRFVFPGAKPPCISPAITTKKELQKTEEPRGFDADPPQKSERKSEFQEEKPWDFCFLQDFIGVKKLA